MSMDLNSLTTQELSILTNRALMPAKQNLLLKLEKYLAALSETLSPSVKKAIFLPEEVVSSSPKISKGENYQSQPYRVLDYPRAFSGKDIFTFRTLILWGYEIGFHLILGGKYKEAYQKNIAEQIQKLPTTFLFSCQDTPWIWEQENEGLMGINTLNEQMIQQHISEKLFIKLSYYIDLESYETIVQEGHFAWEGFAQCLKG